MNKFENFETYQAIRQIQREFNLIKKVFYCITCAIFIAYYSYQIYRNATYIPFLVPYSLLLAFSLANLIIYFIFEKKEDDDKETRHSKKRNKKLIRRIAKAFTYVIRLFVISFGIYILVVDSHNTFDIIALVVSGVALVGNVLLDFIVDILTRWTELIKLSIKHDYDNHGGMTGIVKDLAGDKVKETIKSEAKSAILGLFNPFKKK